MNVEQSSNASFYNYRLIKKISLSPLQIRIYAVLPIICALAEILFISWDSPLFFIIAAPITGWIHFVISRSVLTIVNQTHFKRWHFCRHLPWIGYLPNHHVPYRIFRKVYLHIVWIGLSIICILLLWSPVSFIVSLLFWHAWFILPHAYTFIKLRGQNKNGLIKLNEQDCSYYMQ